MSDQSVVTTDSKGLEKNEEKVAFYRHPFFRLWGLISLVFFGMQMAFYIFGQDVVQLETGWAIVTFLLTAAFALLTSSFAGAVFTIVIFLFITFFAVVTKSDTAEAEEQPEVNEEQPL